MSKKSSGEEHFTNPKYIKALYKSHVDLHNLFIKNNIAYYSSGGTTLGAERHEGIIPFDNDVDLEVSDNDVPFLMSKDFKSQLKKKGYYIKYHNESKYGKYDWIKIISFKKVAGKKIDVDLFTTHFDYDENGRLRTYYNKYLEEIWPKSFLYIDELLPLKQVKFGKGVMIVPNKAKKYLTRAYGSSWSKKAIITQDPNTHYYLDDPIELDMKSFFPAKEMYHAQEQIKLDKNDPLLTLVGYGFLQR